MRSKLNEKQAENNSLKDTIAQNEVQIEDINTEIQKLNEDIESLK